MAIEIREARITDAAALARVHVDSWRTTYAGIVPDEVLAGLSYEQKTSQWERILSDTDGGAFTYVAEEDASRIVGFASGGPERSGDPIYTGEVYAIYLLATHQRLGLGRRLVWKVAERLAQSGRTTMLIWVLAENPARRFYESLGGRYVREQPITIGITVDGKGRVEVTLQEVAYGWQDTASLTNVDYCPS